MVTFWFQLLIPLAVTFFSAPRKKFFWLRLIVFLSAFTVITVFYSSPSVIPFVHEETGYFLYYIVCYLLAFSIAFICFDMPFLKLFYLIITAFLMQNFAHHVFCLIMRISGVSVGDEYGKTAFLILLGGIYCVVYTAYYVLAIKKFKLHEMDYVPKISLMIAFFFFLVMILLGIYVRHINVAIQENQIVAIGYELYSVILITFILLMQFGVFNIGKMHESNEELEMRIEQGSRYYEIARNNIDEINMRCHDLKHQIAGLKYMADDEQKSVISELENSVLVYESLVKTGNDALDYVLTEKGIYCTTKNINFTVIANGKLLNKMSYNDIYVLFGNALDNAIESVLKIDDVSRRVISLKIEERCGTTRIHLENVLGQSPKFSGGLPESTKIGKGHGYGVKSVKYIAQKYGGNMTVRTDGELFFLDIIIPHE